MNCENIQVVSSRRILQPAPSGSHSSTRAPGRILQPVTHDRSDSSSCTYDRPHSSTCTYHRSPSSTCTYHRPDNPSSRSHSSTRIHFRPDNPSSGSHFSTRTPGHILSLQHQIPRLLNIAAPWVFLSVVFWFPANVALVLI